MGVTNPPAVQAQQMVQVDPPTPIDPGGTPTMDITPTSPQRITSKIPTGGTKVQKTVVTTAADGTATWVFPTAFQNPPAIAAIAQGDAVSPVSVNVTSISPSQVTIKVFKQSSVSVALIGLSVQVLAASPGATSVHLYAAPNPT